MSVPRRKLKPGEFSLRSAVGRALLRHLRDLDTVQAEMLRDVLAIRRRRTPVADGSPVGARVVDTALSRALSADGIVDEGD